MEVCLRSSVGGVSTVMPESPSSVIADSCDGSSTCLFLGLVVSIPEELTMPPSSSSSSSSSLAEFLRMGVCCIRTLLGTLWGRLLVLDEDKVQMLQNAYIDAAPLQLWHDKPPSSETPSLNLRKQCQPQPVRAFNQNLPYLMLT